MKVREHKFNVPTASACTCATLTQVVSYLHAALTYGEDCGRPAWKECVRVNPAPVWQEITSQKSSLN